jgi:hypothetical protein
MSLIFDEYGRPFIILREGQAKSRVKGLEAQKVRTRPCPRNRWWGGDGLDNAWTLVLAV